jgi:hypothetical protein
MIPGGVFQVKVADPQLLGGFPLFGLCGARGFCCYRRPRYYQRDREDLYLWLTAWPASVRRTRADQNERARSRTFVVHEVCRRTGIAAGSVIDEFSIYERESTTLRYAITYDSERPSFLEFRVEERSGPKHGRPSGLGLSARHHDRIDELVDDIERVVATASVNDWNEPLGWFRTKWQAGVYWEHGWSKNDLPRLRRDVRDEVDVHHARHRGRCRPEILERRVTHTRSKRSAFDGYDGGEHWKRTCDEVAKLQLKRKRAGSKLVLVGDHG